MAFKGAKKQAKAEKRARREAVRRAERRRNLISLMVVLGVVLVGSGLIALTIYQDRQADQEAAAELEALQSEAASEAERVASRDVACDAQAPAGAQGGPSEEPTAYPSPDMVLEEGVDYAAVVETSCGTMRLDLAEDRAPETVGAFVSLARDGFYDGLEIFRNATTIGALQTGSGNDTASFDIGYTLPDELSIAEEEGYPPGSVAMANSGPNSAGSQFFFVYSGLFDAAFAENRAYTRFATVTEGMDVLERIGSIETVGDPEQQSPTSEIPSEIVYMESVEIVEDAAGEAPGDASPTPGTTPTAPTPTPTPIPTGR
jgi:cyclophilin family peptidyl-prolyl cis-trans isomerase